MVESLLELESARKRLKEIESERIEFLEIIKKLKGIKNTIEPFSEKLRGDLKSIENKEVELESLISAANAKFKNFEKFTAQLVNELGLKTESIIQNASSNVMQIRKAFEDFSSIKSKELEGALTHIQSEYNQFKDEQIEKLDQITKAYERVRTTYDVIKNVVDSIELALGTVKKDLENNQSKINNVEESIQGSLSNIDQKIDSLQTEIGNGIEKANNRFLGLEKMTKQFEQNEAMLVAQIGKQKKITLIVLGIILLILLEIFLKWVI